MLCKYHECHAKNDMDGVQESMDEMDEHQDEMRELKEKGMIIPMGHWNAYIDILMVKMKMANKIKHIEKGSQWAKELEHKEKEWKWLLRDEKFWAKIEERNKIMKFLKEKEKEMQEKNITTDDWDFFKHNKMDEESKRKLNFKRRAYEDDDD